MIRRSRSLSTIVLTRRACGTSACLNFSTLVAQRAAWDRRLMTLYTRRQLLVLLILLAVAGLGLAVGHWRRANPDLADHLEQLDRAAAPATSAPELGGRGPATRPAAEPEPRRSRRRGVTRDAGPDDPP